MNVFDRKQTSETLAYSFDVANELAPNETVNAVVASIALRSGADPTPATMLTGVATFVGTKGTQLLNGGIDGNYYLLTMTFTTSAQIITATGVVPVINGEQ